MSINTKYRTEAAEIMDDFSLEGETLRDALDKIAAINRLLGGNKLTLQGVRTLLSNIGDERTLTIIDVGCGNGDMLRSLANFGYKNNIDFIWTRFFYVYGPGQKETSLIPYLIKCVREGKTPEIKNPNAKNDFIYVEDLAEALAELVENKVKTNVYNIGSGKLTAVQDVVKIIYENFKLEPKKKDTAPGSTDIYSDFFADISKIKKDAGWQPKTTIEQGIKNTIDYLNKQ